MSLSTPSPDNIVHDYMSVTEVALYFRISKDCVRKACKSGNLKYKPFTKRRHRIYIVDAIAWFNTEDQEK